MLAVGSLIGGRFRVDRTLGSGGMGVVVAATHTELGHRVAIKLLRDELAHSPVIVERFLREARSVVGLRTEHVCKVTDVGRLDSGAPYIVMELLEGVDLQRSVAKQPLPVTMAVEYVLQACIALAEAHAAGIIHRDLKPANLFVTRRLDGGPLVKVLDFGIAKAMFETGAHLTHQSAMGSPGYMSPEQIQSARDVDVRTDIWALGVTLYQLLSARMPFPGSTTTEIAIKVANDPPAPLEVDPVLRAVVWKCLEKQPGQRHATIGELMTALAPFGGTAARAHVNLAGTLGGFSVVTPAPMTAPMTVPMTVPTQLTAG
ncbi:MAG: serine/threonine-protein kinase, partial [Kofleriaceae bacterium]